MVFRTDIRFRSALAVGILVLAGIVHAGTWNRSIDDNHFVFSSTQPFGVQRIEIQRIGVRVLRDPNGGRGAQYFWSYPRKQNMETIVLRSSAKAITTTISVDLARLSSPGFTISEAESSLLRLRKGEFYEISADAGHASAQFCFLGGESKELKDTSLRPALIQATREAGLHSYVWQCDWPHEKLREKEQ